MSEFPNYEAATAQDAAALEDEAPVTRGELECTVCGADLSYGGRGPKPKYCDAHRKTARKTSTATGAKQAPKLAKALHTQISSVALIVAMVNQADGVAILNGSERLATSLAQVADTNPKVRKALEAAVSGGAWGGVIVAAVTIAVPILVNHGLVPVPANAGNLAQMFNNVNATDAKAA